MRINFVQKAKTSENNFSCYFCMLYFDRNKRLGMNDAALPSNWFSALLCHGLTSAFWFCSMDSNYPLRTWARKSGNKLTLPWLKQRDQPRFGRRRLEIEQERDGAQVWPWPGALSARDLAVYKHVGPNSMDCLFEMQVGKGMALTNDMKESNEVPRTKYHLILSI